MKSGSDSPDVRARSPGTPRRRSRQREEIMRVLEQSNDHPTADVIYSRVRRRIRRLSLATVYRNLRLLEEDGRVSRIEVAAGHDRFDATLHAHYHLRCTDCGALVDLPLPPDTDLDRRASRASGLRVISHRIEFLGTCRSCQAAPAG